MNRLALTFWWFFHHRDYISASLCFLAALTVYLRTMAPSLIEGDPVEFAIVSYVLGISHPTGYPLFILLGHLFTKLPWGDVAWRLNFMSALLAAGAVMGAYLLLRQLAVRPLLALLGAGLFAFSPGLWTTAIRTDVHGLNALFAALCTLWLLRWAGHSQEDGWQYLVAFAFFYGLSLTNHITAYLMAPGFLVYIFIHGRRLWRYPRHLLRVALAFLLPLLFYLYIPIRGGQLMADPSLALDPARLGIPLRITWGIVSPHYRGGGWQGFLNLVFIGDYIPYLTNITWKALDDLATLLDFFLRYLGPISLPLALLGLGLQAKRHPRQALLLGLIFVAFASQVIYCWEQDLNIFLIPAYLVVVAWAGSGLEGLVQALQDRLGPLIPWLPSAITALALLLLPGHQLLANYAAMDHSNDWAVPRFADSVMQMGLPQGAVLLGGWDTIPPIRYRQMIDGQRRDLVPIHVGLGSPAFYDIVERCRRKQQPVYMIEPFPEEERAAAPTRFPRKIVPLPLYGDVRPQWLAYTNIANEVALLGYDLDPERPKVGGALHLRFYWQALKDIHTDYEFFVRLITPKSRVANQITRQPVSPYFATSHWKEGQIFTSEVHLLIPPNTPPGQYNLEVAWILGDNLLPLIREGGRIEIAPIVLKEMFVTGLQGPDTD